MFVPLSMKRVTGLGEAVVDDTLTKEQSDIIDAFLARLGTPKKPVTESHGEAVTESYAVLKKDF